MKIDCIDKFNMEKLDEEIEKFEIITDKEPYLFMSDDTANLLKESINNMYGDTFAFKFHNEPLIEKRFFWYRGLRVYVNNELELGVVELR